jgi:hypothetical protein
MGYQKLKKRLYLINLVHVISTSTQMYCEFTDLASTKSILISLISLCSKLIYYETRNMENIASLRWKNEHMRWCN